MPTADDVRLEYEAVFGVYRQRFQTLRSTKPQTAIEQLVWEADANLVEDHFHPEIAGPLQMAAYFLALKAQP